MTISYNAFFSSICELNAFLIFLFVVKEINLDLFLSTNLTNPD
ncbi:hypothetical protein SAMN04488018_1058 [Myroides marinus]|uniref:Uncharacterized protein n=1 Tax=Myroides marinus TaxID=703342 RepID=A0A1H6TVH8_9FLAO|nr:hypothetical protein SAMN04488018_1058 [Myroides marinus]